MAKETAPPEHPPQEYIPREPGQSFFDAINANKRNSLLLMAVVCMIVFVLCLALGHIWGIGYYGLFIGLFIGLVYAAFSYYMGSKVVLALSGAKPLKKSDHPYLFHLVEGLALAAQIPKPKVYIVEDRALNAFATGRDPEHSAIVVTRGLLEKLDRQELEGVVAHEMSHIANYDIRFMMLTIVMVGLVGFLSEIILRTFIWGGVRGGNRRGGDSGLIMVLGLILAILAPIVAMMVRFAISRQREYLADASAVRLTRYPDGLKNALIKIRDNYKPVKLATDSTAPMYFADPIGKKVAGMFATHPPIGDRIKRLSSF
ncbi:M48 family metalloprotease [Candidatus Micrarchaeota archaeon]|nr:M48 family metalloprotease [Candidatus Micrarchaeota archaeon]MBD3417617.1 M48 family metalloprotease [Candidatus Micrarchaeota archaeon]